MKWYDWIGIVALPTACGIFMALLAMCLFPQNLGLQVITFTATAIFIAILGAWHDYTVIKRGK